jgi:hypothetical protein
MLAVGRDADGGDIGFKGGIRHRARIAHLTAHLGVERRLIEGDFAFSSSEETATPSTNKPMTVASRDRAGHKEFGRGLEGHQILGLLMEGFDLAAGISRAFTLLFHAVSQSHPYRQKRHFRRRFLW